MDAKFISDDLSVSAQIGVHDIEAIKAAGFRSIMCNRPDNESEGQPNFTDIAQVAEQAGLTTHFLPVISGQIQSNDVMAFEQQLNTLEKPVFAYCRSGTRCTILWALSQITKQDHSVIIDTAQQAGYDVAEIVKKTTDSI